MNSKTLEEMTAVEMRQEVEEIELAIRLVGRGNVKDEALARLNELQDRLKEHTDGTE